MIAIGEHRFDPRVLVAQAADDVLQPSSTSTGDISNSLDDRAAISVVAGRNRRSNIELSGPGYPHRAADRKSVVGLRLNLTGGSIHALPFGFTYGSRRSLAAARHPLPSCGDRLVDLGARHSGDLQDSSPISERQ